MMPAAQSHVPDLLHLLARQSLEHAFVLLDAQGKVTWWSPGAARIFQHSPEEMVGKPLDSLFTREDNERGIPEFELEGAAKDDAAEDDRWQERKDGSRFWASGVLVALRREDGTLLGYGKILRNRTDQRELVETLRNRIGALEDRARRQDAFLSTLSHELANPLGPLLNATRIIRSAVTASEEVEFALRVIERQTQLLRTLVSDLLEFSRAGAGKIELKRVRVALDEAVRHAVDDCRELARERRHDLQVIAPRSPIHVLADPERLQQVFVNLLTNAIKYTPSGGRVSIKSTIEADEAVVRVEDTGVGISHEMLPRIFELFTQVEETRPMSMGGLGIGLALVKELVSLHGGTVQVLSEGRGRGSEFTVRLPLADSVGSQRPAPP
jgi:PAS domain S-box-containing protein